MASMVAPTCRVHLGVAVTGNQSPRFGQQLHGKHFIQLTGSFATSRCWTPEISKALKPEIFTKKTFQIHSHPRSSVINRSAHIARPTFSTTNL